MMDLDDLLTRLTSRKFLLAVAAFVSALANGQPWLAALSAAIYVLVEGVVDAKHS